MRKRVGVCCSGVSPMLAAISRHAPSCHARLAIAISNAPEVHCMTASFPLQIRAGLLHIPLKGMRPCGFSVE